MLDAHQQKKEKTHLRSIYQKKELIQDASLVLNIDFSLYLASI